MKYLSLLSTFSLLFIVGVSSANASPHVRHGHNHSHKTVVVQRNIVRPAPLRSAVTRLAGSVLTVLPHGHKRIVHDRISYYYHDGIYYLREGRGYVVVKPARGMRVLSLPRGFTTVRVGRDTLYRFNDVLYRRDKGIYIVV